MDNVLITADSHDILRNKIKETEFVAAQGGFYFNPWVVSDENLPGKAVGIALPNVAMAEEEKALGTYWAVRDDNFYVKADLVQPLKKLK